MTVLIDSEEVVTVRGVFGRKLMRSKSLLNRKLRSYICNLAIAECLVPRDLVSFP